MVVRLTPQDAAFYDVEASSSPVHIGSLAILENVDGRLDYDGLLGIVERRLSLVPRYRKKVRRVPFGLGRPVWVDDTEFDIAYHIRRSALPTPGTDEQLHELVARLSSRPLDDTLPLWEMYLIEGLTGNRCAIFTKSHSALVDGDSALEIGHVILDADVTPRRIADDLWMPDHEPTQLSLTTDALTELAIRPRAGAELVRRTVGDVTTVVGSTARSVARRVTSMQSVARRTPSSPLNAPISRNRRFAVAKTRLDDYRLIRTRLGCTTNDAILAVVAGALRNWLFSRGEPVTESTSLRVLAPMSVYTGENDGPSEVSPFLLDLAVGEPNPIMRLSHIAHATEMHARQSPGVRARTLVRLAGFAPASLHALSVRTASAYPPRAFNLMVTNAPGPQVPMYVGGARMLEMYPVSPLLRNQALSIGLTSYDGTVYYGFNGDRDAMPDIAVVPAMLYESMEEMLDASG